MTEKSRLPVRIQTHPYFADHTFGGKTVFPAVEAMQTLAGSVLEHHPETDTGNMADARFEKFLCIDPDANETEAFTELESDDAGGVVSKLITVFQAKKSSIKRTIAHVTLCFQPSDNPISPPPADAAAALEGVCLSVDAEDLYRDLVPFGPAYQNLTGKIRLSEKGAIATIRAPVVDAPEGPLGSPFPLDAAFHAACAWGQRFSGMVGFPIGFARRHIFKPTEPGEAYVTKIIPVDPTPPVLTFDIWIFDNQGNAREAVLGVLMKDPSGGRMRPPEWIADTQARNRLGHIRANCTDFCVIELDTVASFAENAMSQRELARTTKMLDKRKRSYFSARLVCKTLSRRWSGNDTDTPGHVIETVRSDGIRPCCPLTDGTVPRACSVSHDSRFAFAAMSETDIGVDVERLSERVLKSRHYYMNESETALANDSDLGEIGASTRIWSVKECAAKILNIGLGRTWARATVIDIGPNQSRFLLDGDIHTAHHDTVDDHLFTVVTTKRLTG